MERQVIPVKRSRPKFLRQGLPRCSIYLRSGQRASRHRKNSVRQTVVRLMRNNITQK